MKKYLLLLILPVLTFTACKEDAPTQIDLITHHNWKLESWTVGGEEKLGTFTETTFEFINGQFVQVDVETVVEASLTFSRDEKVTFFYTETTDGATETTAYNGAFSLDERTKKLILILDDNNGEVLTFDTTIDTLDDALLEFSGTYSEKSSVKSTVVKAVKA